MKCQKRTFRQVAEISGRLERVSNEHVFEIKHVKDESANQVSALEARVKHAVEELHNALNAFKALDDAERGKLETRVVGSLERETVTLAGKIVSVIIFDDSVKFRISKCFYRRNVNSMK